MEREATTLDMLLENLETFAAAPGGVVKLRELVLDLAVRGKLVEQNENDEPASSLLEKLIEAKRQAITTGKLKKTKSLPSVKADDEPYSVPNGWAWSRLNDVFDVRDGTHDTPKYVRDGIPLVTSKNLSSGKLDLSNVKYISEQDHEEISRRSGVQRGDILFAMIGSIGNPVLVDTDVPFSAKNVAIFKYYLPLLPDPRFLQWFLTDAAHHMRVQAAGGVQSFVSLTYLRKYLFPLPPLAEQKRIVAKVDELMKLCDELETQNTRRSEVRTAASRSALAHVTGSTTRSELERSWQRVNDHFGALYSVPETLGDLRQTILQLAVQGKLVPQDPADEPAEVLLERIGESKANWIAEGSSTAVNLKQTHTNGDLFGLPGSWIWVQIADIFDVSGGITKNPQRRPNKNHYPYLRVANVQRGRLDLDQIERFELFDGELDRWRLQAGDLLIVEGNGSEKEIGRCALWSNEIEDCVHQNHIIRVRPIDHDAQGFIIMFLNSPVGIAEMKSRAITTSGLYSLSVGKIRSLSVPLPPLAEQKRIVAKVDDLLTRLDGLATLLESRGRTTQTLLEAAIHGVLEGV
ncbi:Type-1 restriction enzyme EcoEI specificity protein (S.EcoEI) (Type I restriction enzyme EcoEI specificity protein) (S protein) [Durusdinium trenchii]|uniref:Type-1 restriction enzyme EcoEI specificity protein (S.EcoEI) (Type I restriction enzyme EcoEI specificity protein) (S protein) n=1 Tax=Durusdinium trenchii TaxID=1381693 RepID=A0ABP0LEG9_9DINO